MSQSVTICCNVNFGYFGCDNEIIRVKGEGWTEFFEGWQGCSDGFPKGKARRKF